MAKLTKKQREWFETFARNIVTNTAIINLQQRGFTTEPETVAQIQAVVNNQDITVLAEATADAMLAKTDFATLVKVEKLLNRPDVVSAMKAAAEVGLAVEEHVYPLVNELFNLEEATE